MFNTRVLQLLESPQLMNNADLDLLKKEISDHPYVQSIRALYLLGIHKFAPESYHDELTLTAAYTTDKKILYRLINPAPKLESTLPPIPEYHAEPYQPSVQVPEQTATEVPLPTSDLNIEENVAKGTLEATPELPQPEGFETPAQAIVEGAEETINDKIEEPIQSFENKVEDSTIETPSFTTTEEPLNSIQPEIHETVSESLTEANLETNLDNSEETTAESQPEESFQAAEENIKEPTQFVENQPDLPVVESQSSETEDTRLNFTETDSFLPDVAFEVSKEHSTYVGGKDRNEVPKYEPNGFEKTFVPTESNNVPEELSGDSTLNFTPEVFENIEPAKAAAVEPAHITEPQEKVVDQPESNIPHFMNTWQNWLHQRVPDASTSNVNNDSIDEFIRTNPRIRGSKEGTDYVVKESSGDLSHLMTETLAELYLKQKSYDKAAQAFETLKLKHPDRAEVYQQKIDYIRSIEK